MNVIQNNDASVICFSRTGQRHAKEGVECQDVYTIVEKTGFQFYGLADGQSGKSCSGIGGQEVLCAIAQYVEQKSIQTLVGCKYVDEIQYELIRVVRRILLKLSDAYGVEAEEFSSTVVAVAIDQRTHDYLIIHLGDGVVIGAHNQDGAIILSAPENGITLRSTWLTTSPNAMSHLRITRGTTRNLHRIILLSDGATMLCRGRCINQKAEDVLNDPGNPKGIIEEIRTTCHEDDVCCIVIDLSKLDKKV